LHVENKLNKSPIFALRPLMLFEAKLPALQQQYDWKYQSQCLAELLLILYDSGPLGRRIFDWKSADIC
jgi:hypothetical protein